MFPPPITVENEALTLVFDPIDFPEDGDVYLQSINSDYMLQETIIRVKQRISPEACRCL